MSDDRRILEAELYRARREAYPTLREMLAEIYGPLVDLEREARRTISRRRRRNHEEKSR